MKVLSARQSTKALVLRHWWRDKTGSGTSPTLSYNGQCDVEQDKCPCPRKLQPFRREGKTHNDPASYTGPKPFIPTKSYKEHQYYLKTGKLQFSGRMSQRHLYTAPCPTPGQPLKQLPEARVHLCVWGCVWWGSK